MKKIYFLATFLCIGFAGTVFGQYTATNTGNWTSSITWAPGVMPSTVCTNCTITINTGVTVTLDAHVELAGSSILTLGSGGDGAAKIIVGNNNATATTVPTGFNIVLDYLPGSSKIRLTTANSKIDASAAGEFDGIFTGPLPGSVYEKVVGNAPNLFLGSTVLSNSPPVYGQILSGPSTLNANGILPIVVTNFNVALNDNIANLTWSTALEVNFSHFAVQRSGDGRTWVSIGTVEGKNAPSGASYAFIDPSPLHGLNYYRLQAVDLDRNYRLSEVKLIRAAFIKGLRLGPNPANDHLNVTFGEDISSSVIVRLVDQYGHIMQQKQLINAAGTTVSFQIGNYPQGIYTLHIKGADGTQNAYRVLVTH
ncbi:MAG TPA: T9SS type A sorting domain-containing protein [Puia sp.]|jgi:hypothetical protein|nr:T9SS type A sorting domain-containing protein [Puia sp.]